MPFPFIHFNGTSKPEAGEREQAERGGRRGRESRHALHDEPLMHVPTFSNKLAQTCIGVTEARYQTQ